MTRLAMAIRAAITALWWEVAFWSLIALMVRLIAFAGDALHGLHG